MGKIFDSEIERVKKISAYNKQRASRMLDDMGTAFISTELGDLDKSLISVRVAKKAMRAQGVSKEEIDDYFLQRSYLSKTTLRQIRAESIFTEGTTSINPVIECIPAFHTDKSTTDLIIDVLHSRPALLKALRKGVSKQAVSYHGVTAPTLLIEFYNKHKDIID